MKLLVVTPYYYPKIGGLETYARQLNIALKERENYTIIIVTSNHTSHRTVVDHVDGMTIYRLGTWLKLSNTPVNLLWPLYIRRIIKKEKPDAILAHTPVPSMADAATLAAGRLPFLLTYHASTLLKGDAPLFNAIATLYGVYERMTLRRANRILAVSGYVKHALGPSLAHKTSIAPNAVWKSEIIHRTQPTKTNFLFVGSLDHTHAWKGLDLIIRSIELYKQYNMNVTLTIMGDGNDRPRYEALVKQCNLTKQVTFLGAQIGEEKEKAFSQATALVMYPTSANDAFPTVMLEAWARDVPVIAAAIGPLPSLITDKIDGYLVTPHDSKALAKTLRTVAQSNREERAKIAQTASTRTQNDYTWETQATSIDAVIKECL